MMEKQLAKNIDEIMPEVYTVADIQKILRISRVVAYKLVNEESFPAIRIKKSIRIPKDSFNEWLKLNSTR